VLKGISYKQGLIPAMLVDIATKNQEWSQNSEKSKTVSASNNINKDTKVDMKAAQSDISNIEKREKMESETKLDRNDRLEKVKSVIEKKVREGYV
jgi:hypothetical protein